MCCIQFIFSSLKYDCLSLVRAPKSNKSTPKTPTGAEWVVNPWTEKMSDLDSEEFSQSVLAGMRTVFQYIAGAGTQLHNL